MCGIFGLITKPNSYFTDNSITSCLNYLAIMSESRGKDSSGIAFRDVKDEKVYIIKGDVPIRSLLNSMDYSYSLNKSIESFRLGNGFSALGHARLVTNGSQLHEHNNQPVIKDGIFTIHNGIITNVEQIWKANQSFKRKYLIDTEIIPTLIRHELDKNYDIVISYSNALSKLEGTYSIASMFKDLEQFVLATNNGSLYYLTDNDLYFIFASEKYFLEKLKHKLSNFNFKTNNAIQQVESNLGVVVELDTLKIDFFRIGESKISIPLKFTDNYYAQQKYILKNKESKKEIIIDPSIYINRSTENHLINLLENNIDRIKKLKRCTKCLLPITFPFIEYDDEGICNYCNNYEHNNIGKLIDELKELVEPYRKKNKTNDCIVPLSGGRDSTYTLHVVKEILGLNPITFTYDWGMVTDLARRNIARVCGKLQVENIIVSANIHWKRENIRKNIIAWLKSPELGMIPLFMAGDKFFFYYCNQVKKQTGINLNIWGINHLENTDFKTGFAGLPPNFDKKRIYSLSLKNQMVLFKYVARNILKSPKYINQSIWDNIGSFASRYIAPKKDYYHLFDYYPWNETEINELIVNEYKWETAVDSKSTWRVGDGTASFYNYIYYTVAGFTESDTFRSNQIREGYLKRELGLKMIEEENIPRYETIRWYLEILGLDYKQVIDKINKIPKLY